MKTREQQIAKIMIEEEIDNIFNCYEKFINTTLNKTFQIVTYDDQSLFFNFTYKIYCHIMGFNFRYLQDCYESFNKMTSSKILNWILSNRKWLVNEIVSGNIDLSILIDQTAYLKLLELSKIDDFLPRQIHFFIDINNEHYKKYSGYKGKIDPDYLLGIKNEETYTLFAIKQFADQKQASVYSVLCLDSNAICHSQIMQPVKAIRVNHYNGDNDYFGSSFEATIDKLESMKNFADLNNAEVLNSKKIRLQTEKKLSLISETKDDGLCMQRKRSIS